MFAPKLYVTHTDARDLEITDPASDAATLQALADILLEEFPELNDSKPDETIVDVYRRKMRHLRDLTSLAAAF